MSLEALWTVYFGDPSSPLQLQPGLSNAGVVILETGRVFGGDIQYYYTGKYSHENGKILADLDVCHFNGPVSTAFGSAEKNLSVKMIGDWQGDEIHGVMYKVETPEEPLAIYMVRRTELP